MAADKALDWVDLVLCTAGPNGLFMASYTEDEFKRTTQHPLLPGAIAEFNQYEFSRAMRRDCCQQPLKIYSHIAPYMGGPEKIMNTNGAGTGHYRRCCMISPPTVSTGLLCRIPANIPASI